MPYSYCLRITIVIIAKVLFLSQKAYIFGDFPHLIIRLSTYFIVDLGYPRMRYVQLPENSCALIHQHVMLRRKIVDHCPTNLGNKHISSLRVPSVLDLPARLHKPASRRLHPLQVVINFAKAIHVPHTTGMRHQIISPR